MSTERIPALLLLFLLAPLAAEEPAHRPWFRPVSEGDRSKFLKAETAEQKKLRAELSELAKTGQKIYFNANIYGHDDIFVISPDGTGKKRLTSDPGHEIYPHVSPDGKRVLYARKDFFGKPKILRPDYRKLQSEMHLDKRPTRCLHSLTYMMSSDGTDSRPVAFGSLPHWHPNGRVFCTSIAYSSSRWNGRAPTLVDIENKRQRILKQGKASGYPCFTRDGKHLIAVQGPVRLIPLNEEGTDIAPGGRVSVVPAAHKVVCNVEVSPDGKHIAYVVDTYARKGSWLYYQTLKGTKGGKPVKMNLGWPDRSVNYYPDFSPCGRYMVYCHAETTEEISWKCRRAQEMYITRFPPYGVNVRITWNRAANKNPHWVP
jgi:hypothetical protein